MSGGQQKTETKTATDPALLALYQKNDAKANEVADSIQYSPFSGERVAGFNPNQIQAQGILSGIAQDPRYAAATQQAMGTTQGILSANPNTQVNAQTVTPKGYEASLLTAPKPYDAAQLSGTDLSPYLNPYTKNVIDTTLTSQERARQTANMNDNQAATAAGAFGGSRSGVANALTNEAYDRNTGQLVAGLNQANFGQAQGAAQSDIAARNAASQFNSTMGYNTGLFNANAQNAAGQFNSGQDLSAQQFNSGQNFNAQQASIQNALAQAGFKLNAAGQLEALNQADLQRGTQQAGILAGVGQQQQQQQQAQDDAAYEEFLRQLNTPLIAQQVRNQSLGMIPMQSTTTSNTTQKGDLFGGILGAIAGGAQVGQKFYGGG